MLSHLSTCIQGQMDQSDIIQDFAVKVNKDGPNYPFTEFLRKEKEGR